MTTRVTSELISQSPVRDMAAIWLEGGKLIAARPIVAQAIVSRTSGYDETADTDFDWIVYSGGDGAEMVGSNYSFPYDKYGEVVVMPCSSEQWQRLFCDGDAVLSVATELCGIFGITLEGWKA